MHFNIDTLNNAPLNNRMKRARGKEEEKNKQLKMKIKKINNLKPVKEMGTVRGDYNKLTKACKPNIKSIVH